MRQIEAEFISIHAPPRGATVYVWTSLATPVEFQFTPLREGRLTQLWKPTATQSTFQFTPLREGRPVTLEMAMRECISIHAPPRGATVRTWSNWDGTSISIHAPPRGATLYGLIKRFLTIFQFTPLREGRRCLYAWGSVAIFISIHAPPRGATFFPICWNCCRTFQFTPLREGRRNRLRRFTRQIVISIHAPPRGATRAKQLCCASDVYFNSRPSARGDEMQNERKFEA